MPKKILYIEDEQALQKTFSDASKRAGYEVVSAMDGALGFELAKVEKPDLILLDFILPKMNGLEVLEQLRAEEATKEIPVIIFTNLEGPENIEKALELGATTYLVKSQYSMKEVLEKIREIIGE
jgi:DNA-binding response OmpR family regulator